MECRQPLDIFGTRNSSGGDDLTRYRRTDFPHFEDVDAVEHAVAGGVGVNDGADSGGVHLFRQINGFNVRCFHPTFGLNFATAGINADGNALSAELADQSRQLFGMLAGPRSENHPRYAGSQQQFNVVVRADSSADFNGNFNRGANVAQSLYMRRFSDERPVEIHHMEELAAFLDPLFRHVSGRVRINGFFVGQTLPQAHALAALQINCRNNRNHGAGQYPPERRMTRKKKRPVASGSGLYYKAFVSRFLVRIIMDRIIFTSDSTSTDNNSGLSYCECCPRRCGVNRTAGQTGFCRVGGDILLAHAGLHFGEEPPVSGTRGSGTIFFAGCNLHCLFCQNWQISQEFDSSEGRKISPDQLAGEMLRLESEGAHNINFVSPSHMIFQMADAADAARARGLSIPVIYNSNGYDSVEALRQIRGRVDVYLPDLKYMDNELGRRFSAVADYADVVPAALREMFDQVGLLELDDDGLAVRGLLVRHLVLPGQVENSKACLRFLAELSPEITVSIMSQYSPKYKAYSLPELNRTLTAEEYDEITDYALELGLENAFIQTLESQETYLPDFDNETPFFNEGI